MPKLDPEEDWGGCPNIYPCVIRVFFVGGEEDWQSYQENERNEPSCIHQVSLGLGKSRGVTVCPRSLAIFIIYNIGRLHIFVQNRLKYEFSNKTGKKFHFFKGSGFKGSKPRF